MLNNRTVNGLAKIGVLVCNRPGSVPNAIKDVLQATLAQELIASPEWHLDYCGETGVLACNSTLNICDAAKVGYELLDDEFPCGKTFDEDIRGSNVCWCNILFY